MCVCLQVKLCIYNIIYVYTCIILTYVQMYMYNIMHGVYMYKS